MPNRLRVLGLLMALVAPFPVSAQQVLEVNRLVDALKPSRQS